MGDKENLAEGATLMWEDEVARLRQELEAAHALLKAKDQVRSARGSRNGLNRVSQLSRVVHTTPLKVPLLKQDLELSATIGKQLLETNGEMEARFEARMSEMCTRQEVWTNFAFLFRQSLCSAL